MTGKLPIQPRRIQSARKNQKMNAKKGLKVPLRIIVFFKTNGIINNAITKQAIKKIPSNLSVTDLKTAYKGKKYHSGTICEGVINALAML